MAKVWVDLSSMLTNYRMGFEPSSVLDSTELLLVASLLSLLFAILLLDKTDIPYIKNLPSVPALPIYGSLPQLGTEHPKRFAELSKRFGPVFQIRLGNRVCETYNRIKNYLHIKY
jgi:hypothetical protein